MSINTFGAVASSPVNFNPNRRPRIVLINIMDNAEGTEKHFVKTLQTAHPEAEIVLCRMACAKKDAKYFLEQDYLCSDRYQDWQEVIGRDYVDLVIVTGINRGKLTYQDMASQYKGFWNESCSLFRKLQHATRSGQVGHATLVCWSAFAAMKDLYSVDKQIHPKKFYGLFKHYLPEEPHPLLAGIEDREILIPQSRYSYMDEEELNAAIRAHDGTVALNGPDGPALWTLESGRISCIINHPEYSIDTLSREYAKGVEKEGSDFELPQNYDLKDIQRHTETFERLKTLSPLLYRNIIIHALSVRPSQPKPAQHLENQGEIAFMPLGEQVSYG
ncbi:MAG TPA: homoserine O-succinyltransferase [Alphaproteobacteria bacterium]|nr:homoserine O-succinyltransferase [Alphaproteobacteria bacterium]HOO51115.1 homoserine O-succinyltransferase [Alphaproteobacteria bacterium]